MGVICRKGHYRPSPTHMKHYDCYDRIKNKYHYYSFFYLYSCVVTSGEKKLRKKFDERKANLMEKTERRLCVCAAPKKNKNNASVCMKASFCLSFHPYSHKETVLEMMMQFLFYYLFLLHTRSLVEFELSYWKAYGFLVVDMDVRLGSTHSILTTPPSVSDSRKIPLLQVIVKIS